MKLLIKRLVQLLIAVGFILLISSIVITFLFSEEIEKKVVKNIKEQANSEIQIGDVNFNFYQSFPSASVKITNLLAFESAGFNQDTLFYAKNTFIELNIIDLLLKKIDIKQIVISNGSLKIQYDNNNKPNFKIFNTSNKSNNQFNLNKVLLINSSVRYQRKNIYINWYSLNSLVTFKQNKLDIKGKVFSKKLIVQEKDYLNKKNIHLDGVLSFNQDSVSIKSNSIIDIEGVKIKLSGSIINGDILNLNFSCNKQKINEIIRHSPEDLKSIYSSFNADGELTCFGKITGIINNTNNPKLTVNYFIKNGYFKLNQNSFMLKNASFNGTVTNGKEKNFNSTEIEILQFDAKTKKGFINGSAIIKNLNKYYLTANLSSSWSLDEVNTYINDSPFIELTGKLDLKTSYSGRLSFDNKFKNYFIGSKHISDAIFKNTIFKHQDSSLDFNIKHIDCKFKNNTIYINNSDLTISDSDLNFKGKIFNLIAYLWKKEKEITITGDVNSIYIKSDELLPSKQVGYNSNNKSTMPKWINATINPTIKTFAYNDFIAHNVTGLLNYKNQSLTGENMRLKTLNGLAFGNFKFYESKNNQLRLFSQLNLKNINIRNSFLTFNNFNQTFITAQHIKGEGSATIQMEAKWNPDFDLQEQDLKIKSHLIIEQGELINFKPLESLSDYVDLEDLKRVKFSKLENTIEVDNKIITIPTMEIKSSALSVFLEGTHTFDQIIDYRIKLLLSELISKKFRKKNTTINDSKFGEIKKNGKIFNTVYLKMTGNSDNPKITFDGIRFAENVRKEIKQEKETINTIIKEDILKKKKPEKGQEIIIEWDDE